MLLLVPGKVCLQLFKCLPPGGLPGLLIESDFIEGRVVAATASADAPWLAAELIEAYRAHLHTLMNRLLCQGTG